MKFGKIKFLPLLTIVISLIVFSFISPKYLFARSGCCSHHGGVCGCGCCDGTSLSSTCAPYYPNCGGGTVPTINPTPTYKPTPKPTLKPTIVPTSTPTPTLEPTPTPSPEVQGVSATISPSPTPTTESSSPVENIWGFSMLAGVAVLLFKIFAKKNNKVDTPKT